jgi:hypothetical protein
VFADARANAAKIINDSNSIKTDAEKTRVDADELQQRCEQQLHDAQDRRR